MLRLLLTLILVLVSCSPLFASTYYVGVAGSGSICSSGSPCSMSTGLGKLAAGDTLIVNDGTYQGASSMISQPPSGTSGSYITIKAANDGGAIIDGQNTNTPLYAYSRNYIKIEGFKFKNGPYYVGQLGEDPNGVSYWEIRRCAFEGGTGSESGAYASTLLVGYSNHVLFEDCWVYGKGRYKFHTFRSTYLTYRRCIARYDATTVYSGNPQAGFSTYDVSNSIWENCISLDGQQSTEVDAASFYLPANYDGSNDNSFLGCIAVNDQIPGFSVDPNVSSANNAYTNCAVLDGNYGFNIQKSYASNTTIDHGLSWSNSVRGFTVGSATGTVLKNSMIHSNVLGVNGGISPTYSDVYNNSTTYGGGASAGTGMITSNPLLLYPVRIETGSPAKGAAQDGGDMGATILKKYVDGSITTDNLWPWPYEDRIKADIASVSARGFATGTSRDGSSQTLTKYIWEYLGNQIPSDIYGASAAVNASFFGGSINGGSIR
jgi:hypothetical protein